MSRTSTEVRPRVSIPQDRNEPRQLPQETFEVDDIVATAQNAGDEVVYPTGWKLWSSIAAIMLVALAKGLDLTVVAVAIPSLTNEFKTLNDIGWYSAAAGLSLGAFTLFFGKVYQVFPLKPVFLASIIIFTLGILLCTVAPTSAVFILGRAVAGLGSAGVGNGAVIILTSLFPLRKRPLWIGICGGVQSVALLASLFWNELTSLRSINTPHLLRFQRPRTSSIRTAAIIPPKAAEAGLTRHPHHHTSITCLLLALQWGGTRHGWNSPLIISLLVTFGVLLFTFAFIQYKSGNEATLPPRILKNRSMLAGAWFQACCDGTLAMTEYYIAIYFQGVRGFTATKSGALSIPMIIGLMVSTILAGVGTSGWGYYTPFMILSTLIAPIPAGILTTLSPHTPLPNILACLAVLGGAIGLGIQAPFSACQTTLSQSDVPIGNALLTFGGAVGASLFVSASSALFQNRLVIELRENAGGSNITDSIAEGLSGVGLSDIRRVVDPERLGGVLLGYGEAVSQTLYFPLALAVAGLVGGLGMEWKSVKEKRS